MSKGYKEMEVELVEVTPQMRELYFNETGIMSHDYDIAIWYLDNVQTRSSKQVGGNHYQLPIEPITYITKNNLGYIEGNVIKYVTRHKDKGGKEDIQKAIHYLEMLLDNYNE